MKILRSAIDFFHVMKLFAHNLKLRACTKTRNNETKRAKQNHRNHRNERNETTETSKMVSKKK